MLYRCCLSRAPVRQLSAYWPAIAAGAAERGRAAANVDTGSATADLLRPMKLNLAIACDDAHVRPDGKVDVVGIFNELTAPGFPAAQDRMTVVFVMEWEPQEAGRQPLRADLLDESGSMILTIQGHTDVEARSPDRAPAQTRVIMPLERVIFPKAGRYTFRLKAGQVEVPAFSLFVSQRDNAQDPDVQARV